MLQHRWQSWLTFVGVMLGVTMVVAVDLANSSARRAFELSLETVTGPITHQIVGGPGGIAESVYTDIRTKLALRSSAPLVTGQVSIADHSFTLLGTDPFSEATLDRFSLGLQGRGLSSALLSDRAVMLSSRAADKLNLRVDQTFVLRVGGRDLSVTLAGIFPSDNPAATESLLFADIAVAQRLLNRYGRLDRIDLILETKDHDRLKEWLPAGLSLVKSDTRNDSLRQMTEAFHINLTAMSLLALLVAALLIYNTVTLSVLQRRKTLGIYRSLGVKRGEIFVLVLSESMLLALTASTAGVGLGLLLGQSLVKLVTRTVNDLYFTLHVTSFLIDPLALVKGFLLGLGFTMLAAVPAAFEATRSPPVSVQQRSALEQRWRRRIPQLSAVGVLMMLLGALLVSREQGSLVEGFVALTSIVLGFCLIVPAVVMLLTRALLFLCAPVLSSTARMSVRGISAGVSRTGMAVAALTVAVSVTIGVGVMVGSFRQTVAVWLEQSVNGDVYVSREDRFDGGLTPGLIDSLERLPGVAFTTTNRIANVETEFGPLRLLAMTHARDDKRMPIKEGVAGALQLFDEGKGVFVSEPLAYHQQLKPGGAISLSTDRGTRQFPILGVFYDYTSSRGVIRLHRDLYRRWWDDDTITGLTLYGSSDAGQKELLERVRDTLVLMGSRCRASSNGEIRQIIMDIFDRTFLITHVLRMLAVLVAFVGVLSALMALQLERMREFAILRATGMTAGQIAGVIFGQTGVMGLFAGLLSLPLGLLMADILIEVINRRAFGWSMQHLVPPGVLAEALLLALAAALLAGAYPAFRASSISPVEALREE
jgi:putative ABC transport system permease protein